MYPILELTNKEVIVPVSTNLEKQQCHCSTESIASITSNGKNEKYFFYNFSLKIKF